MKVNICASLVSLQAFVVANVRDNVRLQYLQDCCYYGIQEKGNCSRGCIWMREGFIFWGVGQGKGRDIDCGYIWTVGGSVAHFCAC